MQSHKVVVDGVVDWLVDGAVDCVVEVGAVDWLVDVGVVDVVFVGAVDCVVGAGVCWVSVLDAASRRRRSSSSVLEDVSRWIGAWAGGPGWMLSKWWPNRSARARSVAGVSAAGARTARCTAATGAAVAARPGVGSRARAVIRASPAAAGSPARA